MPHLITPANSPVSSPQRGFPSAAEVQAMRTGHVRTGGGYSTDGIAHNLFHVAEKVASQFRQGDGGMFNGALANHVESRIRTTQEVNSFLLDRSSVNAVGVQYFENTSASRPPVQWTQLQDNAMGAMPPTMNSMAAGHELYTSHYVAPGAFVSEDSVLSLDRPTMSTMNKTRIVKDKHFHDTRYTAGRAASPSRSKLHTSHLTAASQRLQQTSSTTVLDRTLHSVDGSCCNYNHPVQHAKVDGLFVTFCENNVETKLFNAVRDLEIERSNRDMDSKVNRQQLAAYLRQVEDLTRENETLKKSLQQTSVTHKEESGDLRILKEEYERKYREQKDQWEQLSKTFSETSTQNQELQALSGSRLNRINELEAELRAAKATQQSSDKQLRDMQDRMIAALAQSSLACETRDKLDAELRDTKLLLAAKEQIVDGLQRSLREAEEKINGIAILRDQVRNANRKR